MLCTLPSQLCDFLLDIDAHQPGKVAAQDFLFSLSGQLRITIARHQVFRQLKLPESVECPAGMPDGSLTTVEESCPRHTRTSASPCSPQIAWEHAR